MKKVVINSCFGGFSLSPLATKELAKLEGKECHFFTHDFTPGGKFEEKYSPLSLEEAEKSFMWFAFSIPNPNEVLGKEKDWHLMSQKEREENNELYRKYSIENREFARDNKNLIAVVEKLGEKANGKFAELKIVEIPEEVDFVIEEYDGLETIAEKHRTWS